MSELEARVAALERQLEELDDRIIAAAHKLRDDKGFIGPFWTGGADHMGEHVLTRAGRKIFLWVITGLAGWALLWAGSTKFWAS